MLVGLNNNGNLRAQSPLKSNVSGLSQKLNSKPMSDTVSFNGTCPILPETKTLAEAVFSRIKQESTLVIDALKAIEEARGVKIEWDKGTSEGVKVYGAKLDLMLEGQTRDCKKLQGFKTGLYDEKLGVIANEEERYEFNFPSSETHHFNYIELKDEKIIDEDCVSPKMARKLNERAQEYLKSLLGEQNALPQTPDANKSFITKILDRLLGRNN